MSPSAGGRNVCWAIVPAAGRGARMGTACPKQYLTLAGRPVIRHVIDRLAAHPAIAGVVVALAADDDRWDPAWAPDGARLVTVAGGAERCHSVLNALRMLADQAAHGDWALVHDAARPCLRESDLTRLIETLAQDPVGGLLGVPVADTLKRLDEAGERVEETVDRRGIWRALTPQMFRVGLLTEVLAAAVAAGVEVTDEAAAMEQAGYRPRMVPGAADNIKITVPGDLTLAEAFLARETEG